MNRPRCRWCGAKLSQLPWNYQKGRFGRYGDDLFCGLRCGYAWACKSLGVDPQTFRGSTCSGIKTPGEPGWTT